ncbi:hypothetical protein DESPIG_02148 [Desulfovibrio piger ATCC 29098]|uniref:Uncharacterized protein n=1 Tax=Desulfovibrio piger ATCC 29098 TaxID=411464 RepID=B6WVN0_9BACT|nr:hypothetical protein DESPIG_02148 [Desulfovibrio piger ATCC 29098]
MAAARHHGLVKRGDAARAGACAASGPYTPCPALRPAVKAAILRKDARSILSALQQ